MRIVRFSWCASLAWVIFSSLSFVAMAAEPEVTSTRQIGELSWMENYSDAYREAVNQHKQLLILFRDNKHPENTADLEKKILAHEELQPILETFVRVELPLDVLAPPKPKLEATLVDSKASEQKTDGVKPAVAALETTPAVAPAKVEEEAPQKLLEAHAFHHMRRLPGLAIIDLMDKKDALFGQVVSACPVDEWNFTTPASLQTVLELPRGRLTQRVLVYVLRTHPERPLSVWGTSKLWLAEQARHHSNLMAQYYSVGHHDWGNRSALIGQTLGSYPSEVASLGGGATILQAAHSAVQIWRSSGVHWGMMISPNRFFGYDMVQASNGTWYATGIFVQ